MREVFRQLILEFRDTAIPEPISRDIELPELPKQVRKAFVYMGMRRSGKTWSLYQRMHELMSEGVHKTQLIYINFEDDRLSGVSASDLQCILDVYWQLYPEHVESDQLHFFFDEIAEIEGWESFIRRLLDKEQMQIYLSGSSAKMLSKEIATNLRGRTIAREIFPIDFKEYLNSESVQFREALTTKKEATLRHHADKYLRWGGFPETLGVDPALHRELLQSYMDTVIYRDIIERHNLKNHAALRELLLHCLRNPAGLLSINKVFNQFKSRGISVSKDSLYEYVAYFEDAYCLFPVPIYTFSLNKSGMKSKKIYPVDTGLITAYSIKPGYEDGSLLETAVFLHLRRQYREIYYYRTQQGREVDFLAMAPNGEMSLYQVSLSLREDSTRKRETKAITEAMHELGLKKGAIVTLDESEDIELPHGSVQVLPYWKLLLAALPEE